MKRVPRLRSLAAAALLVLSAASATAAPPASGTDSTFQIPVEFRKLPNGLKVVLSRDTTAPVAVVAVYYNIGFRIEPKDRTGFAHLFEHMMFQGSQNLGKMEFIKLVQSNGGILNGSTRFDFTNYFEVVPAHALETALWAEADRMKGLAINADNLKNQQEVVKNEVRVNVLNRPYGGFPWLDLPQYANANWYNAHNFYGDLKDLDAATLEDVSQFFKTFYAPNNAALVVVGDFDPAATNAWIDKYFSAIPASKLPANHIFPISGVQRNFPDVVPPCSRTPSSLHHGHALEGLLEVRSMPRFSLVGFVQQSKHKSCCVHTTLLRHSHPENAVHPITSWA